MSLLIRPVLQRFEGPRGYLLRLAEANFLKPADLALMGVTLDMESLQHWGLLPNPDLDPELYQYVQLLTQTWQTQPKIWNMQASRFCPLCLQEEPVWQAGWELYFHDACPVHGVWLVDKCSSCGQTVRWDREAVMRCQCGADLRQESAAECGPQVVQLARTLQDALHQRPVEAPVPLKGMTVEQIQRVIKFFGAHFQPEAGARPLKIYRAGTMASSWSVTTHAAEILADWPLAFHRALDRLESRHVSRSLKRTLGQTYRYLYTVLAAPIYDQIRYAFEEWLVQNWKGGFAKRNRRFAESAMRYAAWIPAKIAADMMGLTTKRIKFLVRSGLLEGQMNFDLSGRGFLSVRRSGLEEAEKYLQGGVTLKMAANMLGFTRRRFREILLLLFPYASRSKGPRSLSPWYIPLADIEAILAIRQDLPVVFIVDETDVSIANLMRFFQWTEAELVALIRETLDGTIKAVAVQDGLAGVTAIVYRDAEVRLWRDRHKQGQGNWLTARQVCQILKINLEALFDFIHLGFIESTMLPNSLPGGGHRIARAEVERFQKEFVTSTEVARTLDCSPNTVNAALKKANIQPVSGPKVDSGLQALYAREAVEAFLATRGR